MIPFVILAIEDEGDRSFMTEVYFQYERLIWSEIRKVLKDHPEAEDVFQTCLMKLVRNVKKLRSLTTERELVNYIMTAAQHTALDAVRGKKNQPMESINDEEWGGRYSLRSEEDLEELLYRRESVAQLEAVWPLLDERSRYLLEGKYFLDLSTREMGAVLHITHDSVRVELSRARKKVRKLLEEQRSKTEL